MNPPTSGGTTITSAESFSSTPSSIAYTQPGPSNRRNFSQAYPHDLHHRYSRHSLPPSLRRSYREQEYLDGNIQEMRNAVLQQPRGNKVFKFQFDNDIVNMEDNNEEEITRSPFDASQQCLVVDLEVFYATLTFQSCTTKGRSRPLSCYSIVYGHSR